MYSECKNSKLPQTECDIPMPEVVKPKENNDMKIFLVERPANEWCKIMKW